MSCTYSRILSSHPAWIVCAAALVSISCVVLVFTARSLPDFNDPQLGFECRGTVLAKRATAWENLLRATRRTGPLSTNPLEHSTASSATHLKKSEHSLQSNKQQHKKRPQKDQANVGQSKNYGAVRVTAGNSLEEADVGEPASWRASHPFDVLRGRDAPDKANAVNHSHFEWGETVTRSPAHLARQKPVWSQLQQLGTAGLLRANGDADDDADAAEDDVDELPKQPAKKRKQSRNETSETFPFCDQPHAEYAHVVFTPADNETSSLWTLDAIRDVCKADEALRSSPLFPSVCQQTGSRRNRRCCSSWSIGHYLAVMRNRSSCRELDEEDVRSGLAVLESCAKYYHALQLSAHCDAILQEGGESGTRTSGCPDVPDTCSRHNAVYHLLHYLTDAEFLSENGTGRLRYANLFLPVARSTALLPYYHSVKDVRLAGNATVRLAGMDLGLKEALFNEYVIRDVVLLCVGAALVCLFMWWYTGSVFLTFMSVAAVFLSLAVAYAIYSFVFELEFFPFMNLLAAVILVGVGADDVFVYAQVWRCTKLDKDGTTLTKLVADTLGHAGLAMLVTSLTTASAFFSSFVCPVTAVRCFSLFAGLSVCVHFAFMLTWLPASVLLAEKYCTSTALCCWRSVLPNPARRIAHVASDVGRITFDKILPCIVVKLRYFWIALFGGLVVGASVAVFYYPKLELPDSKEFQLFSSTHPFERYDLEFKTEFWFERSQRADAVAKLPLRFVWGVKAEDTGNYLDPASKGALVLDPAFNVAAPESQRWLAEFCRSIRNEPFYQPTLGPLLPNCFIETFESWMQRRCEDAIDRKNRTPCCESSRFPYSEEVFNQCILLAVKDLYETPAQFFLPGVAGPRFSRSTPHRIEAVVVEYDSSVSYSLSHQEMHKFYRQVENWMAKQLESAPESMKGGWFTSDLAFYDVQQSLSESTVSSIGLAMAIALVVLVCATGNLWLSFIAVVCLSSVVIVTVAVLVLLGWKLNILESVSVSVAVGLSVDFTLHYAVGYRMSGQEADRESAVVFSLSRMSSPIAMAAITTLSAGAAVLPSSVVAYQQIGTFVVVVMITSWLYSTLFLPSLLRVLGPQRGFSQIKCPSCASCLFCCCTPSRTRHVDKTVYSYGLSESTVSTSSTTCPNQNVAVVHSPNGETHELEPLRSKAARSNRPANDADSAENDTDNSLTRRPKRTVPDSRLKKNAPVTVALLSAADDDRRESEVVCIETQSTDMWSA